VKPRRVVFTDHFLAQGLDDLRLSLRDAGLSPAEADQVFTIAASDVQRRRRHVAELEAIGPHLR
jgi:hypothetical protein